MNVHKNARLTPRGREWMVSLAARGQTPQAVAGAVGVCPRTVRKWLKRHESDGVAGLADRSRANDRHLTVLRQVGEMGFYAIFQRAAAGLHLVAALRLDVRPAGFDDRRGGEGVRRGAGGDRLP